LSFLLLDVTVNPAMSETVAQRIERVNGIVRQQLFEKKGIRGLSQLRRAFKTADFSGNRQLDKDEFEEAMGYSGLFLTKQDISLLFKYYDQSGDGNISYDEFVSGLAQPISSQPRRYKLVMKVFDMMDRSGNGIIESNDVAHLYNAKKHPDVRTGEKSEEDVLVEFLKGFEGKKESKTKDGRITRAEFEAYYSELSASIPSDTYFVSMMESVWMVREDGTPDETQVRLKELMTILKEKVRQKTAVGKEDKETLYQTFKFFDRDDSKSVTKDEFKWSMEKYGIMLDRRELSSFFANFDPDNSGSISYKEFIATIFDADK